MNAMQSYRRSKKMTQRQLAKVLKVSHARISQIEKNGLVNKNIAVEYAAKLGCNWQDLMD